MITSANFSFMHINFIKLHFSFYCRTFCLILIFLFNPNKMVNVKPICLSPPGYEFFTSNVQGQKLFEFIV